jgi:hypothetical protein
VLRQLVPFFDAARPTAPVRAFYSLLPGWTEHATVELPAAHPDQAALGGEVIHHLRPDRRAAFKQFVEARCVDLGPGESHDDFFAQYDRALDAVDPRFRKRNGIYFTDLDLARLAMWYARELLGDIGRDHLVIDPACGSGNLVTSWQSPLELRHKVVSEIDPELLFAVERRMRGDQWQAGRFTVVLRTAEDRGLNFLDRPGAAYLAELRRHLEAGGHALDRPLAFLCNPPYRSDDDQTVSSIPYQIHPSILDETGLDASAERYCCFLSQIKQVARAARDSGVPGEPLLLVFTKAAWLTDRPVFSRVRAAMLGAFEDLGGLLVDGKAFFDVQARFPIAFTVWRYKGERAGLDPGRPVRLVDLTWLGKAALAEVPWHEPEAAARRCRALLDDPRSPAVTFALGRQNIRAWSGCRRFDFQREKTKQEQATPGFRCGLPAGDPRHGRKKTLGFADGAYVGFMDDLTPCRIRHRTEPVPYFHLDTRFMRVRRYRCFSGPADNRSFHPASPAQAARLFVWFALGRTFAQEGFPIWADAFELWPPRPEPAPDAVLVRFAYAIGYADNECVALTLPAGDPVPGAPEVRVGNPMTPLDPGSYWSRSLAPAFADRGSDAPARLVAAVDRVFADWRRLATGGEDAGLLQIRDHAKARGDAGLREALGAMTGELRAAKAALAALLGSGGAIRYFAPEA